MCYSINHITTALKDCCKTTIKKWSGVVVFVVVSINVLIYIYIYIVKVDFGLIVVHPLCLFSFLVA